MTPTDLIHDQARLQTRNQTQGPHQRPKSSQVLGRTVRCGTVTGPTRTQVRSNGLFAWVANGTWGEPGRVPMKETRRGFHHLHQW